MKRKRLKMLASMALLGVVGLGLAACETDETPSNTTTPPTITTDDNTSGGSTTTTPTTPVEVTVTSITLENGKRQFDVGDEWSIGDLVVKANMSNGTTKDVTKDATIDYSQVKLDVAGTYQVNVTFSGKSTSYSVYVVKPKTDQIVVNTDSAKVNFLVGDTFTSEGILVRLIPVDGAEEDLNEFSVKLYKDANLTQEVTDNKLIDVQTYYVKVTAGDLFTTYTINVTKEQHVVHTAFSANDLEIISKIVQKQVLYKDDIANNKISVFATESKYTSVDENSATFDNGTSFSKRFKLGGSALGTGQSKIEVDENGDPLNPRTIKLELGKDSSVRIYARSGKNTETRNLIITDLGAYSETYETVDAAVSKTFELKAGTYYIYSRSSGINIYGIDIDYSVDKDTVTYSELSIDSSALPESFNINEDIDLSSLVVKAKNNYGAYDTLAAKDYKVTDSEGKEVKQFTKAGTYTLTVTFGKMTKTFDIQVINPNATIVGLEVQTQADKLVYKKGETFTLDALVLKATDSDNLVSSIEWTDTDLKYRILNGEEDVTETFTSLNKGKYIVELTYKQAKTTYEITVLEVSDYLFDSPVLDVLKGSTNIDCSGAQLVLKYTDGTDKDYSAYDDTILWNVEGFEFKFYQDQELTVEKTVSELATTAGNTFYGVMTYGDYKSSTLKFTVVDTILEQYLIAKEHTGADESAATSNNPFFKLEGTVLFRSSGETPFAFELEKGSAGGIKFTTVMESTVTFVLNTTNNSENASLYVLKDSTGKEISDKNNGFYVTGQKKDGTGTTVVYENLPAGTYTLYCQQPTSVANDAEVIAANGTKTIVEKITGKNLQVASASVIYNIQE